MGMKITQIIPDLHLRWRHAQQILDSVQADEVIFLGDFFDDFGDCPQAINEMIDWLESIINRPNYIFLYGNHDLHYACPQEHLRCSGYAQWKHFIIRDRLNQKFWDHFKFYHFLDDKWLLSHGGLHNLNLPSKICDLHEDRPTFFRKVDEFLEDASTKAFRETSWFTHAGLSRGGLHRVGGLTWCDFEREFYPIIGLNQIVGHTPQGLGFPKWCVLKKGERVSYRPYETWKPKPALVDDVNASVNIDLDVHLNLHWGLWDGTNLTVLNYQDDL